MRHAPERLDVAQVCLNGHATNPSTQLHPEHNVAHCPDCGAATIMQCPACQTSIRGKIHEHLYISWTPPRHCHKCGAPYPWTAARIASLSDLIDMADLDDNNKNALKRDVPDLIVETPRTRVAAARMARFLRAAGTAYTRAIRGAFAEVACDVAKEAIGSLLSDDEPASGGSRR